MNPTINYYEVLQVSPNASQEVIEAAYKRLAKIYHPDLGGNDQQMSLLNEAYQVLHNPNSRQAYDEELAAREFIGIQQQVFMEELEKAAIPRPWVRYFARQLDYIIWGLILGTVLFLFAPNWYYSIFSTMHGPVAGMIVLATWMPIEACFLYYFRTTPGKWLLRTYVVSLRDNRITFVQALQRSFMVLFNGCAMGIPLLSIIFLAISYNYLVKNKFTSWDLGLGTVVLHGKVGIARGVIIAFITIGLLFFLALL